MSKRLDMLNRDIGFSDVDITVNSENVKRMVNERLNAEPSERKLYMKHKIFKAMAAAAAITGLVATSAFAVSPAGQETINSVIAYFTSDKAAEMTSMEELEKYNEEIGKSVTKNGYTLTLDNVAADDNFIHVFYTIKSDSVPFYEGESVEAAIYSGSVNAQMNVECVINGSVAGLSNHNSYDGYFADNYTYKVAAKYNFVTQNVPDIFKVELFADMTNQGYDSVFDKLFKDEYDMITDEDKENIWYVSAEADKSKVKVETVTKEINQKLPWSGVNIEKIVFSPFGNQIVVTAEAGGEDFTRADWFALYDENGTALDVLNTDLRGSTDGASINALEFLKADKNTKQLTFVPINLKEHGDSKVTERKIGAYPLVYQVNDYGKVVVTDIRISDGEIDIDYYKDGFVMYDPGFCLTDDYGNNAEPGGKLGCTLYTDTHYETNSYTARYVYEEYMDDGRRIPFDEGPSAEELKRSFTTLGCVEQMYFDLDFGRAVTVELK
ncbi:MAG: DUF4179 domain-containing protein [bacterium]|nr:DUF4179 domain-containing protein [bacterium]